MEIKADGTVELYYVEFGDSGQIAKEKLNERHSSEIPFISHVPLQLQHINFRLNFPAMTANENRDRESEISSYRLKFQMIYFCKQNLESIKRIP